jgi:hypothetical protein
MSKTESIIPSILELSREDRSKIATMNIMNIISKQIFTVNLILARTSYRYAYNWQDVKQFKNTEKISTFLDVLFEKISNSYDGNTTKDDIVNGNETYYLYETTISILDNITDFLQQYKKKIFGRRSRIYQILLW